MDCRACKGLLGELMLGAAEAGGGAPRACS